MLFSFNQKLYGTLLEYNIAGYHLFNPGVTNMQGGIEISLVLIGGVIAVVSMLIAGYLVFLIGKEGKVEKKVYKTKEKKETRMQTAKRMVIPANSENGNRMLYFLQEVDFVFSSQYYMKF